MSSWTLVTLVSVLLAAGCAGAPWFLGEPLDGKPAIPATSRAATVADHRRALEHARAAEQKVIELAELCALEDRGALHIADTKRLIELLKERARDWSALGRAIPLAADLRHIVALDPTRARSLGRVLGVALRGAGDAWLALGENARAEEEYSGAQRLGADGMDYRLRAAWGASPADLDGEAITRAVAVLPERVLAPFVSAYLDAGGAQPRLLRRAWMAARVYGPPALQARIEATPAAAGFESLAPASSRSPASPLSRGAGEGSTPRVTVIEPGPDEWLFSGPTLARTLLPLAEMFPDLLAPGVRSRTWADRLVAEDPTSPDSLEVAALIDARAGRLGGAARKLGDLVYYSADRAAGYERTARVWRRVGQVRRACVAFERAAHLGAWDDPRWCDLVACARDDKGAANSEAVDRYVKERAPTLACVGVDAGLGSNPDAGLDSDVARIPTEEAATHDGGLPDTRD